MNLAYLLERASRIWPRGRAVSSGCDEHATYSEFAQRAARIGGALSTTFGLAAGDRVAIVMKNSPEYLEALYGLWYAGLVAVPVNAKLHAREIAYILEDSGAALCFVSAELEDAIGVAVPGVVVGAGEWTALQDALPIDIAPVRGEDIAWLFYTSGTTGQPKGAMLSHGNLRAMVLAFFVDVEQLLPGDSMLHPAPLSHGSGLYSIAAVQAGSNQVVPASGQFEPGEIYDLIAAYPGAFFFAAPTMVKRLVEAPLAAAADTTNLKNIVYGGGPMYLADLRAALDLFGYKLGQIYGQGECPMTITALGKAMHESATDARLTSVGVAHSVVEVRVVDESGATLPPGTVGEICVRSDVVMQGYWNRPDATAAAIRDGWLYTGDMGALDPDGFLSLKDRSKDVIISGGSNIYPREVEEVLLTHAAVDEVSVVGEPDAQWGEAVVAFVVPAPGKTVSGEELDRLCLDSIARFKRPKRYMFVSALPKNNYGKILKTELRNMLDG
ncbi:MAG: AMP-binding protein [Halioglobus sp.]|nr:AMP-binding protein [Halioglobus sp.]